MADGGKGILKELNPEQLSAVTHRDGPLLVIAGAGTGKTLCIAHRIAHLINQGIKPDRILALTFTEKAASEMEERVDRLTPYGYTNVLISTFHSFGDRVLRDNALSIGLSPDFKVLSDPERSIFLKENLFELPLSYYRPLGNPTRYCQAILNLISRAKDEDVSPEEYLRFAEGLKKEAEQNPDNRELCDYAAQQMELALTYKRYQELMQKKGFLDFGDQICLLLRLFRERPAILKDYQKRFDYILVDEFQDTNYAQFQLVKLLAEEHRNITVVGDDDQSIYKFRGAAVSNILNFKDTYPDAKEVVLTKNYRSTQGILDAAYRLIVYNNPDRLEFKNKIDKRLEAVKAVGKGEVCHLHFDSISSEADGVAERIIKEMEEHKRSYRDFVILVRANSDADPFINALKGKGIPFRFSGSKGLYSREEIRLLIAFLKVIVDYTDNLSLFHLASSELYGLKAEDLIPCHNLSNRRKTPLYYVMKDLSNQLATHNLPLSQEGIATISKLITDIKEYSERALKERVGELLYSYIKEQGYLQRLIADNTIKGVERVQNIAKFFDILFRLENSLAIDRAHTLVKHLDTLIEAGDDPPTAEVDTEVDAVSVMTVHKAKGLEFPVVFMVGLVADRFPRRERREAIELPLLLIKETLPQGNFQLQEERRLFYVGMTRAMERLYLTSARDYGGVRAKKMSPFILEALNLPKPESGLIKPTYIESIERFSRGSKGREGENPFRSEGVITLTPYEIDDYLTCPLKYKYIHILRIPVLPHHSVIYGKAVHDALSKYFRNKQAGRIIPFEEVTAVFKASWRSEGFITKEHEVMRFEAGLNLLKRFYEEDKDGGIMPSAVEREFLVDMDSYRLKGRWDLIEERGEGAFIIDFKTSEVRDQKKADEAAKKSLQLTLYSFAYREVFGRMAAGAELYFLDSNPEMNSGQVLVGRTTPDDKAIDKALSSINEVLNGLRDGDFSPTPDYLNCTYCFFNTICPSTATRT